jgi:O-antigen/teichoic acid export membrane protein
MAASAARHTLGASLLGLIAIVPLGLLIPVIFGALYAPAVIPCLIIAPGIAVYSLAPVLSTYFSGQLGRPLIPSLLAALSLSLDLVLVWLFVPRWGAAGAALASGVAYGVTVIVMVGLFRRASHAPLRELVAFQRTDLAAYAALFNGALGRLRRRA